MALQQQLTRLQHDRESVSTFGLMSELTSIASVVRCRVPKLLTLALQMHSNNSLAALGLRDRNTTAGARLEQRAKCGVPQTSATSETAWGWVAMSAGEGGIRGTLSPDSVIGSVDFQRGGL